MPARGPRVTAERLATRDGHTVPRPLGDGVFDLTYVRTGPRGGTPLLVLPGGPGMASVLPYHAFRQRAARRGMDVIMVEHRGVGLSRTDRAGADLPLDALSVRQVVDDLIAVLDDAGVPQAVVYGCSYGSYLAQALGVWHPERMAGMVLDSPMWSTGDFGVARERLRQLFWDGVHPETAAVAAKLRGLVDTGVVPAEQAGEVVMVVYELAGLDTLDRLLDELEAGRGRRLWDWVHRLVARELSQPRRYVMEFDLAGVIQYRELYDLQPDGLPLDLSIPFTAAGQRFPAFAGEPLDLPARVHEFGGPTAVLSGTRDLRTPPPVAQRIARTVPDGVLVPFDRLAHSVLDTHPAAAVYAAGAVLHGAHHALPELAPRLDALPQPPPRRALPRMLNLMLTAERALPGTRR